MHEWYENSLWKCYFEVRLWIFQKGIVVLPPSLFLFSFSLFLLPHWLFLFISHLSSLGSFHVSSFGIFYLCPLWDLFLTRATLYILQGWRRSTHFYKVLIIKLKLYHDVSNVCLCQCNRICNDTSASCSNYVWEKPNYRAALPSSKSMYDNEE